MWTRAFEDEDESEEEVERPSAAGEPEYAFDGFDIEFSERVVLTAAQAPRGNGANGDRRSVPVLRGDR